MPAAQHDPPMSKAEAARKSWALTADRAARTAAARAAADEKIGELADPDGELPPEQRRGYYYRRLSALGVIARTEKRRAQEASDDPAA